MLDTWELSRDERVVVDVELCEAKLAFALLRELVEQRRKLVTGSRPVAFPCASGALPIAENPLD